MNLPHNFFNPLIEKAKELIAPSKITLFGSFARGDEREKSDIDLAFKFDGGQESWTQFKSWVEDDFKTLRELDLVNLDEADESIVKSVKKEGITLYER
jgi:uncharacterized protein